jgi:transcriptional regulator with GAF, ATPase, and Fis domain
VDVGVPPLRERREDVIELALIVWLTLRAFRTLARRAQSTT